MQPTQLLLQSDVSADIPLLAEHAKSGGMQTRFEVRCLMPEPTSIRLKGGGEQRLFVFPGTRPNIVVRMFKTLWRARLFWSMLADRHNCNPIIVRVWHDHGLLSGRPAFEAVVTL